MPDSRDKGAITKLVTAAAWSNFSAQMEVSIPIIATKLLPKEALEHLRYAFEFLSLVSVRHQAREVEAGNAPSNYIEPEQFSASERQHLKEAFQVISNAQKFLRFRYPAQPASRPR